MESNNNSASLQSSSGGDDEYDSRAATSYSPFLTQQQQQQFSQPYSNTQITPSMFDPSPPGYNFANQNPLLNLDMLTWSKSFRSGDPPQAIIHHNSQPQTIQPHRATGVRPSSSPEQGTNTSCRVGPGSGVGPVRNKKRSRASRRAPTTVLTTDTTNFRAMVQEFTGIPAPPFSTSSSSLFPRTTTNRLDLFSNTPPNYGLLRPFVTKIQQPPTTHVSTANNNNNFQLPPPIVNSSQLNSNNSNNNPMLSFQSLLHSSSASPNYSSLPQFNHALSGLEAGTSSPTTMMMRRIRSNISYADPRQQQQQQQQEENADQEENVASRS